VSWRLPVKSLTVPANMPWRPGRSARAATRALRLFLAKKVSDSFLPDRRPTSASNDRPDALRNGERG
jgi:hypothetical protein